MISGAAAIPVLVHLAVGAQKGVVTEGSALGERLLLCGQPVGEPLELDVAAVERLEPREPCLLAGELGVALRERVALLPELERRPRPLPLALLGGLERLLGTPARGIRALDPLPEVVDPLLLRLEALRLVGECLLRPLARLARRGELGLELLHARPQREKLALARLGLGERVLALRRLVAGRAEAGEAPVELGRLRLGGGDARGALLELAERGGERAAALFRHAVDDPGGVSDEVVLESAAQACQGGSPPVAADRVRGLFK